MQWDCGKYSDRIFYMMQECKAGFYSCYTGSVIIIKKAKMNTAVVLYKLKQSSHGPP